MVDFLMIPPHSEEIPTEISSDPKISPFFDECIGAIDGSHITSAVEESEHQAFRNCKGFLSQNVLGVVNFDLTFQVTLTGWEGIAHDGKI